MSEPIEGPRQISDVILELEITGCVTPFTDRNQPMLVAMPGTDDLFVAVFSSIEKLRALWDDYPELGKIGRIKVIMNGPEFIASVVDAAPHLRIIVDPHRHPNGKLRFTEVIPRGN